MKPYAYGKLIATSNRVSASEDTVTIFKGFNTAEFSKYVDFSKVWSDKVGGHFTRISKYYDTLNTETGYAEKAETERLIILKQFEEGLNIGLATDK